MNDLFGNNELEKVRTLGFYQPFGSLMIHGKIETRWVREGKKPPFPLGMYLFYTTKESANGLKLMDWCGPEIIDIITHRLCGEETCSMNGYAIAVGELINVRHLKKEDEPLAFVKYQGSKILYDGNGKILTQRQWALIFENVKTIKPFKYEFGKQGVGFLPNQYRHLIN